MKLAPADERYRISGAMTLMFEKEVFVYSLLLKKFSELQQCFPSQCRMIIPRCYFASNDYCKEALVLQNMTSEGYKPYVSNMFLDLDHVIVSLKSIATFHALSFIVKSNDEDFFNKIANECKPLSEKTNKRFMEILRDRLTKVIELFESTSYGCILQKMKIDCAKLIELVGDRGAVKDTVICHGDIWKENIMFKYENNKPVSSCLLDYQTARLSSPAFDFLYLITVSCDSTIRRQHMQELIKIYHGFLSDILLMSNSRVDHIYSLEDFQEDLKAVAPACLIVANTALWLFSGLVIEGHVRSKHPYKNEEEKLKALNSQRILVTFVRKGSTFGWHKKLATRPPGCGRAAVIIDILVGLVTSILVAAYYKRLFAHERLVMAENRNAGEKEEGSGSAKPAHCIIRRQFRAAEFRALYCNAFV
ncbi:Uncharacterized oxidoreductase dhs-27 [Eumeta japonica]|uniref:Uncharacterized oxidoreductase dhs-27 n=1 Tax=Eumeta variegata TaxID=151549 RepID=A0A4C1ZH00_EUMVA|nr:Uncharacterized oxidoreductase dhs-27 [Eumeta japonica]